MMTWSFQVRAQFDPGTTVFIMDSVSDLETAIENISDEDKEEAQEEADALVEASDASQDGDTSTVTIPVRQDDGSYESVDIEFTETDNTRTISIPDRGDISVVEDENGDYNFTLTPEEINGSSNVSCSISPSKKGTCTIEPFITMVGDKVLSADKLVLDYKEGENLIVAGGTAHNLKLTDENSETGFFNSQTDAGDAGIGLSFSKNGESESGSFIPTPGNFKDKEFLRLDVDSSRLVHTVRNPEDSSQTGEKFAVKDGGVSSSLIISRQDHLNVNFTGTTHSGVRYNSNPFSNKNVTVDTNAPLSANLIIDNNPDNPRTSVSMGMMGDDAEATIVDNRDSKKTDTLTASGDTFINLSQATLYDEENGKVIDSSKPVAFELGSDKIEVQSKFDNGKTTSAQLVGINASGTVNPENDNKDITIAADSIDIKESKNGKLKQEIGLSGDVRAIMQEDDQSKKYQGMTQHAYYNNGESEMNLSGGALISVTEYKDGAGETFNGKTIKNDAYAMAHSGTIQNGDTKASIDGGIEFRQIGFEDDTSLIAINGDTGNVGNSDYGVNLKDGFTVVNETDANGDTRFTRVTSADTKATDKKSGDSLGLTNSVTTSQLIPNDGGKDTLVVEHSSDGVKYQTGDGKEAADFKGVKANVVDADNVQYGNASFNQATFKTSDSDVQILGAEAVFYTDDKITQGNINFDKLSVKEKNHSIDIMAKGKDGVPGKFKIMFLENEKGKYVKIFGEDGKRVHLDSLDKDGNYTQVLAETVEYFETDKFKQFMASNLSGSFQNVDANDGKLTDFNIGRVAGIESLDGNFRQFEFTDGGFRNFDGSSETGFNFESAVVTDTTEASGSRIITGGMKNGAIDFVDYSPQTGSAKTSANITFGEAIGAKMEGPDGSEITVFKANDIELVAVDFDSAVKASGKVGEVNYYDDEKIQVVEAKDIRDLNIEDTNSGVLAKLNGDQVLRVVERDSSGQETSSYLLMKKGTLDLTDKENGITADIRVGVLEFAQDKVNDTNIILEADVSGKVKVDKTKSPVGAEVNFALKGKNLTTQSSSYVSDDGKTIEKNFKIIALGEEGRLDNLELSAGPDFLKDAISLQAKGSEAGGKELSFSFRQDKAEGTYFVRAEFKDGDKIKVKLFPFTLESIKEGDDAVAELMLTPKGQNYMNHLQIISNVVSGEEITEWLDISDGGMITVRTGDVAGFGFEMMWQDKQYYNPNPMEDFIGPTGQRAATYGLGVYKENDAGDRTSVGLMLSGDSELEYRTNGRGVLKVFNMDMPQNGSIPTTLNLYMKKKWADGDALYTGISADMASYMIDENAINDDARFFENGRSAGGLGATVAYSKNLGEGSHLTFSAGANQDFSSPAFCVTYRTTFGGSKPASKRLKTTMTDTMRAINRMPASGGYNFNSGPSLSGAVASLEREVNYIGRQYDQIKAFERVQESLQKTLTGLEDGSLTPGTYRETFNISKKDIESISTYESKQSGYNDLAKRLEGLNFVLSRETTRERQIARLKQREKSIRDTMDRLTTRFKRESSSEEIMEKYSRKLEELSELRSGS